MICLLSFLRLNNIRTRRETDFTWGERLPVRSTVQNRDHRLPLFSLILSSLTFHISSHLLMCLFAGRCPVHLLGSNIQPRKAWQRSRLRAEPAVETRRASGKPRWHFNKVSRPLRLHLKDSFLSFFFFYIRNGTNIRQFLTENQMQAGWRLKSRNHLQHLSRGGGRVLSFY